MIGWIWMAAATGLGSPSVIEAERGFAALAQRIGQWSAFRATAAPEAVMFVPQPINAHEWMKGRADPAVAVKWQPAAAYVSCDGRTAVTTGPWQRPSSVGYFTTVWNRSGSDWRWLVDLGDAVEKPLPPAPAEVPVKRASCSKVVPSRLPSLAPVARSNRGASPDHTLEWTWRVEGDGFAHLLVYLWNGEQYDVVIDKSVSGANSQGIPASSTQKPVNWTHRPSETGPICVSLQ